MEYSSGEFYGGGVVDEVTLCWLGQSVLVRVRSSKRCCVGGGWPGWNVVHSSPKGPFEVVGECSYANESDTDPGT